MSDRTSIEWTDATWNPIRARNKVTGRVGHYCQKVSPGCANCYAERWNQQGRGTVGTKISYVADAIGFGRTGVTLFLDEEMLTLPLRWRRPRKIFVCSMTDLFADFVPDGWIDRIFAVMLQARRHTFQILTKRARRTREYCAASFVPGGILVAEPSPLNQPEVDPQTWPLPNVWLGISAEDQQRLDERVPDLLKTPAVVRFVSAEPLLGPLVLGWTEVGSAKGGIPMLAGLEWVIVGGESGPGARPMDIAWARDIVRQCREAGVACFMKQMGCWILGDSHGFKVNHWLLANGRGFVPPVIGPNARARPPDAIGFSLWDRKGGDPSEWAEDLRVREFPEVRA